MGKFIEEEKKSCTLFFPKLGTTNHLKQLYHLTTSFSYIESYLEINSVIIARKKKRNKKFRKKKQNST